MKKAILVSCLASLVLSASAKVEMGAPFSDGAVLQRGMKVPVWGKAASGETVRVSFAGQVRTATADADGRWQVVLDPLEASDKGQALAANDVEIKDVLVGEVWFASGQSNMECPIWGSHTHYRDAKGALMTSMTRLPQVRYAKIPRAWSLTPIPQKACWRKFVPADLRTMEHVMTQLAGANTEISLSAVAFYYARELHLALGIPIGIVDACWGGTRIEPWTPGGEAAKSWSGAPHQQPSALFNGMVAAWAPMAMRGFIWYQGCSNSGDPQQVYCAKMHALYDGWTKAFANPDLRLYLVQLAPYSQNWTGVCAAQNQFVAEERNAAIAVTADAGNFNDIHPNDKEIVAKRLAVHALKRDYGFDIPEDDSPVFKAATFGDDGTVTMEFDHVRDWYVYSPCWSREPAFEVAGTNRVWAQAKIVNFRTVRYGDGRTDVTDFIDGPKIVVRSDKVSAPVRVRYMGKPLTAGTLYNEASLPLGPFEAGRR